MAFGLMGLCSTCYSADLLSALTPHPTASVLPGAQHAPAAPSLGARIASGFATGGPAAAARIESRPEAVRPERPAVPTPAARRPLDLSPPDIKPEPGAYSEVPFPSRPRAAGEAAAPTEATEAPEFHFQGSRVKQLAERFHREGLPVARLWETHSALLSLGLNQRGKPGLWLIQKTH
jgi:hypothetical protein